MSNDMSHIIKLLLIIMLISGSSYLNYEVKTAYAHSTSLFRDSANRDTISKRNERKFELVIVINHNFYSSGIWINDNDFSADSTDLINIILSKHPEIVDYGISHIEYSPVNLKPGYFINPILLVTTDMPYYTMDDLIGCQYTALKDNKIYDLLLKNNSKFTLLESINSYKGRKEQCLYSGLWQISKGKIELYFLTGDTLQMDVSSSRELRSHKSKMFNNKRMTFRYISVSDE